MGAKNNPERSSVTKMMSIFLAKTQCRQFENLIIQKTSILHIVGKTVWKNYDSLREHAENIIDFERKKMLPLTKKELKSHEDAKEWYICGKRIQKISKNIKYQKIRDYCH